MTTTMQVTAEAVAHITRLRRNNFRLDFFGEETMDLGIVCIAERGDSLYFVYADGTIANMTPMPEHDGDESYEDWVRGEYIQAIGA